MAQLEMKQYCVGQIGTNCYFLCNTETKQMLIVDPGDQAKQLSEKIAESGYTPVAILLTHGHFDHIMAVDALRSEYQIPVYAGEYEREMLESPEAEMIGLGTLKGNYAADTYVKDGQVLTLAGFLIKVFHTPGHTPGGVCYYLPDEQILMSGDTLFCGSVGRTDFPGGSMSQLVRSVQEKLFTLPEEVKVYPGHERSTSIAFEKQYNPFF
jgi:glyoxylase-like metal-dependent hydrolase (beta-lactamase superfamily II)